MPPKKQFFWITFLMCYGIHCLLTDAGAAQLNDEDGGIVLAEHEFLDVGREHLHRDSRVEHITEPESVQYIGYLVDFSLHSQQLIGGHPLHRYHAGRRQMEIVLQQELPHPGIQLLRQIGKDIVVDGGHDSAYCRRDEQQHRRDEDEPAHPDDGPCDFFHAIPPLNTPKSRENQLYSFFLTYLL